MGSSNNSVTYTAGLSRYIPIDGKNIAYRLIAAYGSGGGERGVLIGTGGSTSIRGYEKGEFEGNRMIQLNSEYRFPITDKYWGGVLFLDGGNAWKRGDSIDIGDINWSTGLGLRLFIKKLVKGVGRLDVAYNMERDEYKAYLGVHHTF
jgi:outer membrane protein insertion porin family